MQEKRGGAYWDLLALGRPPPVWPAFQPPSSLWWFCWFSVLTGGGAPGWRGALAVLRSSSHCLVMWLQGPVNHTFSAARVGSPGPGPWHTRDFHVDALTSTWWVFPSRTPAREGEGAGFQGVGNGPHLVPRALGTSQGTPSGQRGMSESLCRKRRRGQVSPAGWGEL